METKCNLFNIKTIITRTAGLVVCGFLIKSINLLVYRRLINLNKFLL